MRLSSIGASIINLQWTSLYNLQPQQDHNTRHNANNNINVPFYSLSRCHQSLTNNDSKI